jgi:carnosine synthase
MLARARRDALKGKRIILVGAGYPGKRFFFERAKELGIRITLVDKPGSWAKDLAEEFIPVDTTQADTALGAARKKLNRSARWRGTYDGITTFWEDDVVLTARLARELGLAYHSVASAEIARSKFLTRQATMDAGIATPFFRILNSQVDLDAMLAEGGAPFPAILKPVRGAAAQSTVKVNNAAEAREALSRIAKELETSDDPIFKQGREILFDEYLDGREWDVDIVLQGGKVLYRSITDNWPTREPFFLATGSTLPSRMLTAGEQAESMDLAEQALSAAGFKDGIFHVEGKHTSRGARLIELNARPGGMYVVPWNKSVWGVDLTEMLFLTAAGIPAVPFKPSKPRTHLEGEFLIPTESGVLSAVDGAEEVAAMPGFRKLALAKSIGDRVSVPPNGYDRVGMLVAEGSNGEQARRNLESMRSGLRVNILAKP